MIPSYQLAQFGKTVECWDVVYMDFEGADASTTFDDSGTGRSVWTAGGSAALSTAAPAPLAGTASLKCPSATADYIKTAYGANNCLPPYAAWDISVRLRSSSNWAAGGTGKYVLSCQDASATAAGTAFAIVANSGAFPVVVLSDGTTRSIIVTGSGANVFAATTTQDLLVTRRGNTISLSIGGGTPNTGTFSGAINLPAGRDLRIGKPEFALGGTAETLYFDSLRIRVYL